MVSGELAGKAAAEACAKHDFSARFLDRYDNACEHELGKELRKSLEIQRKLLGNPERIDRIVRVARKDQKVRELLADYSLGRITYRQFRRGILPKTFALLRG
jgi:flavin-dependent dehydrogenase